MIDVHYSLFQCFEIDVTNTVELLPVYKNKPKYFEIILVMRTACFFKHKKQISWDILLDREKNLFKWKLFLVIMLSGYFFYLLFASLMHSYGPKMNFVLL